MGVVPLKPPPRQNIVEEWKCEWCDTTISMEHGRCTECGAPRQDVVKSRKLWGARTISYEQDDLNQRRMRHYARISRSGTMTTPTGVEDEKN